MNSVFLALVVGAVVAAAFRGSMHAVTEAGLAGAKQAVVDVAIPLVGQMALWLGFMRVLREAGALQSIGRALAPAMRRLFPEVPPEHPAMSAMILNLAANVLGLGNAATPFGLKAMRELEQLNPHRGVATNSMALFLAINTSGVAVLPLGVIAVRASLGARDAGGIAVPTLLTTALAALVAIAVAKALERRAYFAPERAAPAPAGREAQAASLAAGVPGLEEAEAIAREAPDRSRLRLLAPAAFALLIAVAIGLAGLGSGRGGFELLREVFSDWLLPVLMALIVLFGLAHRVAVYEAFIRGAREGFDIAVMVIPFLVAILVAVGMFRASGMLDVMIEIVRPITDAMGFPAEALPMALVRPLSGQGGLAVMTETMKTYGPDSFVGFLVSVINGSMETTFYVLVLYFGSVGVRAVRHTLIACLAADFAGVVVATLASHAFWSPLT